VEEEDNEEEMFKHTPEGQMTPPTTETDSTSNSTEDQSLVSSPEKKLLSRKVIQALRKIRNARKALTDTSLREELDELLGKGIADYMSNELDEKILNDIANPKISRKRQEQHAEEKKGDEPSIMEKDYIQEMEIESAINPQETQNPGQEGESSNPQRSEKNQGNGKCVSFASAVEQGTTNSQSLRQGNKKIPTLRTRNWLKKINPRTNKALCMLNEFHNTRLE
jgi:hypothetical protein